MLQIIFLNIGLCVILLAIAFVFKKYARVILWSSAITLFVGTLLLVGLGIVNPVIRVLGHNYVSDFSSCISYWCRNSS